MLYFPLIGHFKFKLMVIVPRHADLVITRGGFWAPCFFSPTPLLFLSFFLSFIVWCLCTVWRGLKWKSKQWLPAPLDLSFLLQPWPGLGRPKVHRGPLAAKGFVNSGAKWNVKISGSYLWWGGGGTLRGNGFGIRATPPTTTTPQKVCFPMFCLWRQLTVNTSPLSELWGHSLS